MKSTYSYIALCFLFTACSTEVELPSIDTDGLTVEAIIDIGKTPRVYLTTSLPLIGNEGLDLVRAIEGNAKVEISDGEMSEIATFSVDNTRYPSRYYRFNNVFGEVDKRYQLKITLGGIVYASETSIPVEPNIVLVEAVRVPGAGERYNFKLRFKNSELAQYYKIYIKESEEIKYQEVDTFLVNNELFTTDEYEVYIDYFFINEEGYKKSRLIKDSLYDIKIIAITKEEHLFWKAIKGDDTGNLIGVPKLSKEVPTNITNGAFGYFGGTNEVIVKALCTIKNPT
jgi:hypothetical protein